MAVDDDNDRWILIGDDEQRSPEGLTADSASAATVIAIDQQLYEQGEDPWSRGRHVGEAHGIAVTTHGGRVVCNLTFELGEDDTISMHGVLDLEGGSIGRGQMAVVGGTGKYRGASGNVDVRHQNPKRYRLAL